jgi:hypothetical protein
LRKAPAGDYLPPSSKFSGVAASFALAFRPATSSIPLSLPRLSLEVEARRYPVKLFRGTGQQVADGHSDPAGSVEKHRISAFHFSLHGVAA